MDAEYPAFEPPLCSGLKQLCQRLQEAYRELKEDLAPFKDDRYYRHVQGPTFQMVLNSVTLTVNTNHHTMHTLEQQCEVTRVTGGSDKQFGCLPCGKPGKARNTTVNDLSPDDGWPLLRRAWLCA
ncbi:transmembrane protein [Cricetulus griseus]|uniref:Transmembrane protein n=1 Tax=Cricetulus griseus TaxID=10029 RepID=A0A061IM89_CRIGR|nr:transmembrane protein [Cricetulus griseus]